jgi:flagellin
MSLIINTNIPSLTAQRNLGVSNNQLAKSLERLSSGLRVNRSADDAAGLSIANKLNFQARGLNQAVRNAGDATSLVQTAEGAFNVVTNILGRLRELAVQAASDTNTTADRATLKSESDLLVAELTRLATTTQFNGANLLDGSFASGKVQVGANADQTISFSLADARASQLGKFAAFSTDITDGIGSVGGSQQSGYGNLGTGEFNVNGQLVGATATTDDQVSVLELSYKAAGVGVGSISLGSGTAGGSGAISSMGTSAANGNIAHQLTTGSGGIYINGSLITSVANKDGASIHSGTSSAYLTNSSFVSAFVAKINAAGITNVTARVSGEGSTYTIIATKGTDVKLAYSEANAVAVGSQFSNIGLVSQVVGSGTAASEISTFNGQSGAIAKAAAINSVQSRSGVTATAQPTAVSQATAIAAGSLSATDLVINGFAVGATTVTASDGTGALRAAINAKTSSTGVTATVNSSGMLVLNAADGRNISVAATANTYAVTAIDAGANLYRASLKFVSNDAITFTGTTTDVGALTTNTPYQTDLNNSLSLIDISTQVGANTAITSLDAALQQVSKSRSDVGALQSRLDLTVQSLQTAAENQTAAESRIRDADFAFETAVFTRNQILVQAGTAILAQANSSTQIALQLLQ